MTSYPYDPANANRPYPLVPDPNANASVSGMAGGSHHATSPGASTAQDVADSLRGPVSDVKDSALEAGSQVADTVKDEAREVFQEGKQQGRRVLDEGLAELRSQAAGAQSKLADTLQALADELADMTGGVPSNGTVASLASQAQGYTERAAAWLGDNDMDATMVSVRRFAARNPWGFLALATGAGVVAGRFAKGLKDAADPEPTRVSTIRVSELGSTPGDFGRPHGQVTELDSETFRRRGLDVNPGSGFGFDDDIRRA